MRVGSAHSQLLYGGLLSITSSKRQDRRYRASLSSSATSLSISSTKRSTGISISSSISPKRAVSALTIARRYPTRSTRRSTLSTRRVTRRTVSTFRRRGLTDPLRPNATMNATTASRSRSSFTHRYPVQRKSLLSAYSFHARTARRQST